MLKEKERKQRSYVINEDKSDVILLIGSAHLAVSGIISTKLVTKLKTYFLKITFFKPHTNVMYKPRIFQLLYHETYRNIIGVDVIAVWTTLDSTQINPCFR